MIIISIDNFPASHTMHLSMEEQHYPMTHTTSTFWFYFGFPFYSGEVG